MTALDRFEKWLATHTFVDRNKKLPPGLVLQYHSRSDEHSKILGTYIVDDLLDTCEVLREQAARGDVAFSINHRFTWPNGKAKTIDLAVGIPVVPTTPKGGMRIHQIRGQASSIQPNHTFRRLLIACEEKSVMTEHVKSQPRVYSELNDSHTIVHSGDPETIAAGITMVNIATTFISPLRQRTDRPIAITRHDQPNVTRRMVTHLRKLHLRESRDGIGLDAYCTFLVDLDNQGHIELVTAPPAPQKGDPDHYETFLFRISAFYTARFVDLHQPPQAHVPNLEQQLLAVARTYPGLLARTGDLALSHQLAGSDRLRSILRLFEERANGPLG